MDDSDSADWFGMERTDLIMRLRQVADDLEAVGGAPDKSLPPGVSIKNWALAQRTIPCLIGNATGHPEIGQNRPMFSSPIYYMDIERRIARTFSRWYRLENRVDPEFWNIRTRIAK
ncbi:MULTISPECIES: hypothetical protein [Rhizobium]|uniref:hypothetical protein n=1 Tax=Rhizobium TaxID=379 RepID=UPI001F25D42F|nr:hypothetical protein [Rhizobium leguminosarum]UIJ79108.1 hypothetical protein LZK78_20440 [Rhizobium leguminosarum]